MTCPSTPTRRRVAVGGNLRFFGRQVRAQGSAEATQDTVVVSA